MATCECGRVLRSDAPACSVRGTPYCVGTVYTDGGFDVGHTHVNGRREVPEGIEAGDYFCRFGGHHERA